MIICAIICFTIIVCFTISAKIYYILKINKDFRVKAEDIKSYCHRFIYDYLEGTAYCDASKTKYIGKPSDIYHFCKTILQILENVK